MNRSIATLTTITLASLLTAETATMNSQVHIPDAPFKSALQIFEIAASGTNST